MKHINCTLSVALILALAACAPGQGTKQTGGTLLGAGLGAITGSQIGKGKGKLAAVAIGTLAGAYFGREIGKSLDKADRLAMKQTAQSALENNKIGQKSEWSNPDSGNNGNVTPTRTYQTASGSSCREYQQTVIIGGKTEQAFGRACRQPDGSWKIIN